MKLFDLKSWQQTQPNPDILTALPDYIFGTSESFLFLNDQLAENKKMEICAQVQFFIQDKDLFSAPYLFIPTSGTTSLQLKIVAIKKENFLNAARRVNSFLNSTSEDSWLISLPAHHVAGLSILARAFLKMNPVHYGIKWQTDEFVTRLKKKGINFCSLVPTQIFDLVEKNQEAPISLKRVLVGGSALSDAHFRQMQELGWPLLKTYGMTETAAFFSTSPGDKYYEPLPGVQISLDPTDHLAIQCDSLFDGYLIQDNDNWRFCSKVVHNGFWSTEDKAALDTSNSTHFQILGRDQNMIKIKGELVNVHMLNSRLAELGAEMGFGKELPVLHFYTDPRSEHELFALAPKTQNESLFKSVLSRFNQLVLPFERVGWYIQVDEIPKSDLGKVKSGEFNTATFKEAYFENRKSIL